MIDIDDGMQGVIPQNSFGNIDVYAPTMLPGGAVHLPCQSGVLPMSACILMVFVQTRVSPRSPSS